MFRQILLIAIAACALSLPAAELSFDFSRATVNETPSNFVSKVTGQGQPGDWKVLEIDVPSQLEPLSPDAKSITRRRVLAQLSEDPTDEHFPILIYNGETFGDFTISTRFQCVRGQKEQMAGIAFRVQDEKNYYVVRASALGNTFRFFEVKNGERTAVFGKDISIPAGVWHEMKVECKNTQISCFLNGQQVIPTINSPTFRAGKVGFWTKSDSVSYFVDTRMTYTPRIPLAQRVVSDLMKKYPRLLGLRIVAVKNDKLQVIASADEKEIGMPGESSDDNVIKKDETYCAKTSQSVAVTVPLRDRNGDTIAALWVKMKSFPGQTENNALARALPINQEVSARILSAKEMFE